MNIIHIISSGGIYGAENVVLNLAEMSIFHGHSVCICCIKSNGRPDPELHLEAHRRGIQSITIECRSMLDGEAIKQISKFAIEQNVNLMHSHGYKGDIYAYKASMISNLPIVATAHNWTGENIKVKIYDWIDRITIRKFDHVVAVSPMVNEQLRRLMIPETRRSFIPNGVDIKRYNPSEISRDLRDQYHLNTKFVVGIVGRLSKEKGHRTLFKAVKLLEQRIPNLILFVCGDGPLLNDLKCYATELGIFSRIIFSGVQTDMVAVYNTMNLMVMPSTTEGMPLALLEAMSMGVPVIASRVGGIPLISSNTEIYLIEPENVNMLSEIINECYCDENSRNDKALFARLKVQNEYSLDVMYNKYNNMYLRVVSGHSYA